MVKVTKYREKKQRDTKNNKQTAHLDRVIGVNQPFIFGHGFSWAPNFPVDMCSSDKKNTKKKTRRPRFTFFSHFLDILETLEVLVARSLIMSWPMFSRLSKPRNPTNGGDPGKPGWCGFGSAKASLVVSSNMFRSGFQRAEKFSTLKI